MADVRSIFSLSMKDNASKQLEAFRKNWQSTTKEIESDGGGGMEDMLGGFVSSGLGKVAGAVGAAFATGAVASMTWELARASAESLRVAESFDRLAASAGESGKAMLEAMRTAARGTIDDTSLMLMANKALALGVVRNAEDMAGLIESAMILGREQGISAAQAVEMLVVGIGRMSALRLDDLGIVGVTGMIEEYAQSLGKTSEQLSDVEKKQALLNAVMQSTQGVEIVDDAAAAFERMDTSIKNAKDALGILFSPAIAGLADGLAAAANILVENWKQAGNEMEQMLSDLEDQGMTFFDQWATSGNTFAQTQSQAFNTLGFAITQSNAALKAGVPGAQEWGNTLAFVAQESLRTGEISESNMAVLASLVAIMAQASAATNGFATAMNAAEGDAANLEISIIGVATAARNMAASLRGGFAGQAQSLAVQAVQLGAPLEQVEALLVNTVDAINETDIAYDGSTESLFRNQLAMEGNLEGLQGLVDGYQKAQAAASKLASGGLSDLDRAFGDLQSRVASVLSGSLSLDVGIDPADFLPREDAINENARRLAAIMRDGMGDQEWMEEFKREVPAIFDEIANSGDPKGAAAKILQEFQAGLRPELLDREAVKERVRQMILGDQSMAAMAGEIAQELATEMGVSLQQVQATMGAMGLGGGETGGEGGALGEGIAAGVDGNLIASTTIAKMAKAFLDNEGQIRTAGGVVGAWWGEGFMAVVGDNLPPGLIELLALRVLPIIQATMAAAGSTTGTSDGE